MGFVLITKDTFCRWLSLVLGLVITFTWAASQSRFAQVCGQVRQDTLRLHIVASSDTVADQSLKLRVRDAVLEQAGKLCADAPNQTVAKEILAHNLPMLERTAGRVLVRAGQPMPVKAEMENSYFATTHYTHNTLPAGTYDAVRITLGKGNGHNWWCCLYPALCISAASEYEQEEENAVVSSGKYEIRFALVEWWQNRCNKK